VIVGVHFSELEQFLEELELHAENDEVAIERGVVRVTPIYRPLAGGVAKLCHVRAAFISTRLGSLPEEIHVEALCGQLWGHEEGDAKTCDKRAAMLEALAAAIERLGLEQRGGYYETGVGR
jgi:hypothetical protein